MRTKENVNGAPTVGHSGWTAKDLPSEKDVAQLGAGNFSPGRFETILTSRRFRNVSRGAAVFGGAGLALGAAHVGSDVLDAVVEEIPGVHRDIDSGKFVSSLGLGIDSASADGNYIPAENTPVANTLATPLPGLSPAESRPHATSTATPTETPSPTPTPTRTPEPTVTPSPSPTPTQIPLEKIIQVETKKAVDANGNRVFDSGDHGIAQDYVVWIDDGDGIREGHEPAQGARTNPNGSNVVTFRGTNIGPGSIACSEEVNVSPSLNIVAGKDCDPIDPSGFAVNHLLNENRPVAPPPPPTQPPVKEKFVQPTPKVKFVPPTPTPITFTCPDGRVITLPEPFQGGRATAKEIDLKGEVACTEAITYDLLPKIKDDTGFIREGIGVPDKDNDGHPDDTLYAQADRNKDTIVANDDQNKDKIIGAIDDIKDGRDWLLYGLGAAGVGTLGFGLWRGFRAMGRRLDRIRTDILGHVHGGDGQAQFPQQPEGGQLPEAPHGPAKPKPRRRSGLIGLLPVIGRAPRRPDGPKADTEAAVVVAETPAEEKIETEEVAKLTKEQVAQSIAEVLFSLRDVLDKLERMEESELKPIAESLAPEILGKARDVLRYFDYKDVDGYQPLAVVRLLIEKLQDLDDEELETEVERRLAEMGVPKREEDW